MNHSFNRQTTIAALDIGSSKVCCIIANIGRDKKISIAGYGYNASKGIKNGVITDIKKATISVCDAVEAAEQMADKRVNRVIINISGSKIKSNVKPATINLNKNKPITEADIKKVIEKGINKINVENNELIHCMPTGYRLDYGEETNDPRNLYGENLSVDVLLGLVQSSSYQNSKTVLDGSHLEIVERALSPYASALSCLVEDEKKLGATVIDIGGGTTDIATFKNGHPVYFSSIAVGGDNITSDIAWGLTTSFVYAEKLKNLHGCAFLTRQDEIESIDVYPIGEEDDALIKQVPKSELIKIIAPRVEEIFELVHQKLAEQGLGDVSAHRIVLTGGSSQLQGIREVATMILDKQVRLGKSRNIHNILDISNHQVLQSPAFSTAIGLLLFVINYTERKPTKIINKPANTDSKGLNKIISWIRQNF